MARFHPLKVTDVRRETRDAVVVTLMPRAEDSALFAFTHGQYLTFRRNFDGDELRRSYSICAGCDEGVLKVGIKRVDGGTFSTWANEALVVGDEIEAGVTLTAVGFDFITITRNGTVEQLYLDQAPAAPAAGAPQTPNGLPPQPSAPPPQQVQPQPPVFIAPPPPAPSQQQNLTQQRQVVR